ncbi:unnamed protein product [Protopolystoma xenopodis]|uniref:Uncharacterized protein n=1 Tax=Protopolystoma xenopodis TaxID=117903 RepID=A0A3S5CIZ1_9PLAT|nr:unnamed protein product [Protopolystoma xenopodis]
MAHWGLDPNSSIHCLLFSALHSASIVLNSERNSATTTATSSAITITITITTSNSIIIPYSITPSVCRLKCVTWGVDAFLSGSLHLDGVTVRLAAKADGHKTVATGALACAPISLSAVASIAGLLLPQVSPKASEAISKKNCNRPFVFLGAVKLWRFVERLESAELPSNHSY